LKKSVFIAFVIGLLFTAMLSAQNRVLTQNETLFIDKAVGRSVVFLAGTSVAMGRDGNAISGTLSADTTLSVDKPIGRGTVFKGGTQVSFRPGGDVQTGTLVANTTLLIPVKALGKAAVFRKGTSVVFQGDGCVISGTLAVNTTLLTNTSLGISKTFPAGAVVSFQPDGTAIGNITSPVSPGPVGLLSGSLSGTWTAYQPAKNWSRGGFRIIQNGQDLTYVVFSGERHTGRVLSADTVSYLQSNNATGKVSKDGKRIDWPDGYWTKDSNAPGSDAPRTAAVPNISGAWVDANNSGSTLTISQDGKTLRLQGSVMVSGSQCRWHGAGTVQGSKFSYTCIFDSIYPGGNAHNSSGTIIATLSPDEQSYSMTWKNNGGASGSATYKRVRR